MFKMFVGIDSINASNLLSVKRHLSGWTFVQQRWKLVC